MKNVFLILALAGLATAQTPRPNPHMKSISDGKVKQSILFDGKMFVLKFIDQTQIVDLNEYYLRDETPDNWTHMLSVSLYKTHATPAAMAKNMEDALLKSHPDAPHEMMASPDGKVVLFMCLNWANDRKTTSELAVFRFQQTPGGVLGYQASVRPYQAKLSFEDYKALKDRWAQKIQAGKWPDVTLQMP